MVSACAHAYERHNATAVCDDAVLRVFFHHLYLMSSFAVYAEKTERERERKKIYWEETIEGDEGRLFIDSGEGHRERNDRKWFAFCVFDCSDALSLATYVYLHATAGLPHTTSSEYDRLMERNSNSSRVSSGIGISHQTSLFFQISAFFL